MTNIELARLATAVAAKAARIANECVASSEEADAQVSASARDQFAQVLRGFAFRIESTGE